jgi:penicillin amidase
VRPAARIAAALAVPCAVLITAYVAYVFAGMRVHTRYNGTIASLRGLRSSVSILRDDRGVPHIIAHSERDLFFAQGYVEAADRLFQMDMLRRFAEGRLAEVFGSLALAGDERERAVPVREIVRRQWRALGAHDKALLVAFSRGINAAMAREPLPVEFRILAYRPQPWTPQDSLAASMATVLDLIDDWDAVADRDAAYRKGGRALLEARFPFTDPCYDAPVLSGLNGIAAGPKCAEHHLSALVRELAGARPPVGSNAWAVGSRHALDAHALLANDPHLSLHIPGVWYLVDLRAPGFHAAGAALPGTPGVILGHNEHLAWGATDGTVTSLAVFAPPARVNPAYWQTERFGVRFGHPVTKRYYRGPRDFGVTTENGRFVLVRWNFYTDPVTPAITFFALDRAESISRALRALARFPGPTQNFVLADTHGRVAYALAGSIPDDPVRARWIHPAGDLGKSYPPIPFARLPRIDPSRSAIVWTANNKMYAKTYPLPLSPQFAPPYRAYRIAELLRARHAFSVADFARMQMDVLSLAELELARDLGIRSWDGRMRGGSRTATRIEAVRLRLTQGEKDRMPSVLAALRTHSRAARLRDLALLLSSVRGGQAPAWRIAGAVPVQHPLSSLGLTFLNGVTLPGYGDAFTLHVQYTGFSQSFRAVWDTGDWDAGGIILPQGMSGEPGSGHYTDEAAAWIAGRLWPLPFSPSAVARTTVDRQTLQP